MSRQINLFNAALLPPRPVLTASQVVLGWAVVLLTGLGIYGWLTTQAVTLRGAERAAAANVQALQADIVQLGSKGTGRKPSAALVARVAQRQTLLGARQGTMRKLTGGALGDTAGHARYLRAFARQSVDGLWLTGITVDGPGTAISVQGRTLDPERVPDFLDRLAREPVLSGHGFDHLQMQRPVPAAGAAPGAVPAATPQYVEFSVETRPTAAAAVPGGKS
ncbi:MAG: hypothetical protein B7Z52_03060 [Burkholderiales bacterium 12-64-5]|nr:MAG: hypothetical protein B7Z52_03060 [Burkholderiales bacterium 12-64-5]